MEQKNSRKRLNSLILLVAFTAIMLIVSTYAWFSTQKNVTLGGLKGKVNVAEGLQISLDAKTWKNEIDFGAFTEDEDTGKMVSDVYLPGATLDTPYTGGSNILPGELLPVSTTGTECINTAEEIDMYWGENYDMQKLKKATVKRMDEEVASGYFAIDFFLQNSSKDGVSVDKLQLEPNSDLNLLVSSKETTGLQNTVRVAIALYGNTGDSKVTVNSTPTTAQILEGTANQNIIDVAIWEPNVNAHVQPIVDSLSPQYPVLNDTDEVAAFGSASSDHQKFVLTTTLPTYALTATSVTKAASADIANIYDWTADGVAAGGLQKQITLATTTDGIAEATQLVSAADGSDFEIAAGQYHKCRMYVWLEGQDVDCINYASLGGGIDLDFGFSKPGNS